MYIVYIRKRLMNLKERFDKEVLSKPGKSPEYLIGTTHNNLTVTDFRYRKSGQLIWVCQCFCGRIAYVRSKSSLMKRNGCQSCTASLKSFNRNSKIPHYGYFKRKFKEYREGALKRHLCFELSEELFFKLTQKNCHYCNIEPEEKASQYAVKTEKTRLRFNGIDRVDSSIGYTESNSVACCSDCNYGKHSKSKDSFLKWIKRVHDFNIK